MNLQCIQFFYGIALLTRVIDAKSLGSIEIPSAQDSVDQLTDLMPAKSINSADDRRLVQSYQKFKRRSSPFGIVYKDGKPIGVLEPISRIYEFQNFQDDLSKASNVGRRNVGPPAEEQPNNPDLAANLEVKRAVVGEHDSPSTRTPIKRNPPAKDVKLNVIENNLKEIMSDLSTINQKDNAADADEEENADDAIAKRDAQLEDEDLDDGMNRIDISKEIHAAINGNVGEQPASLTSSDDDDTVAPNAVADYRGEGEKFIRSKRQQQKAMTPESAHSDGNDIVKGLEASGDLTVSGNKSPLASSSETAETKSKSAKSAIGGDNYEKRDKQTAEDVEYQKRLQRNIEERISQIKAQVKREINALKAKTGNSEDMSDAEEAEAFDEHLLRHKRNLNDQKQVDLVRNIDSAALVPHVRLRRKAEAKAGEEVTERDEVAVAKHESEGQLNKLENTDKAKRNLGFTHDGAEDAATAKHAAHEQADRALAGSNLKHVVDAASNDELEKLVKDSSSLTESIKSVGGGGAGNRGARHSENDNSAPAHIEVELHRVVNPNQKQHPDGADAVNVLKRNEVAVVPAIAPAPARDDVEEVLPPAAIGENHAEGSNLVVNAAEEIVLKKRAAKRITEKKHPADEETKVSKTPSSTVSDINAVAADEPTEDGGNAETATSKSEDSAAKELSSSNDDLTKYEGEHHAKEDHKANLVGEEKSNANDKDDAELAKRSPEKVAGVGEDVKPGKRQERKSEPDLSLEDMQALDSENKMRRRRRLAAEDYYLQDKAREKRAQYPLPNYLRYRNYRGEEDEADDESDEFDDDNFDDRAANMVRKRGTSYDDELGENGSLDGGDEYSALAARRFKRHIAAGERMAALHSGGPMTRHLAAVKERNAMRHKRLEKTAGSIASKPAEAVKNGLTSELSDSDIFGALPQSYEGELTRFKRVKRDDPSPIDVINGDNSESP